MNAPVLLTAVDPDTVGKSPFLPTPPRALHEVPSSLQQVETKNEPKRPMTGSGEVDHFTRNIPLDEVVLIPAGATLKGNISTDGRASVIIAGRVEGIVDAGKCSVIIKEGAEVVGTIKADNSIVVAGSVTSTGDEDMAIVTGGLWILAETAKVKGGVAYGRFKTYEGGTFSGRAIPHSEYLDKS
jgi:cytoskeletal protein CcmA (bactofilin family)